jgi:MFS family permease
MICFGMVEALVSPLFVPFLQGTLHASATQIGFAASAQSFGTIGAGLFVVAIASRLGPTRMFVVGAACGSVVILVFGLAPTYTVAVIAYAATGIPSMLTHVGSTTLLQTAVPDELRGRVNGGFNSMFGFTTLLAAAIPAFVSGLVGVRAVVLLGAAFGLVGAGIAVTGHRRLLPDERVAPALEPVQVSA